MKGNFKKALCAMLVVLLIGVPFVVTADDTVTISGVTFDVYQGGADPDLVSVEASFAVGSETDEITILFASEEVADDSETEKILYIDQVARPDDGKFAFVVSKDAIKQATGLSEINGCTLYLMMGGTDISTATVYPVTFNDPYQETTPTAAPTDAPQPTASPFFRRGDANGDGAVTAKDVTKLRRLIANGETDVVAHPEMDVNGDGSITAKDVTRLRRAIANGTTSALALPTDMSKLADVIAGDTSNVKTTLEAYNSLIVFDWSFE